MVHAKPKSYSILLLVIYVIFTVTLYIALPQDRQLADFATFLAAGRAAAEKADPYSVASLVSYVRTENVGYTLWPNLNPPLSLLAFAPLARVEPIGAFRAWIPISLGCYMLSLALLFHAYRPGSLQLGWCLLLTGAWHTLILGQIYLFLGLLAALAWLALDRRRDVASGILIGLLVAIKPNFAVWPVLLLAGGAWLPALAATATAVAASLVPAAVYGPGIYVSWLHAVQVPAATMTAAHNSSLPALLARFGVPALVLPAAAMVALISFAVVWRYRPGVRDIAAIGLVTALITSPVAWVGYTVVLAPVFLARRWDRPWAICAVALVIPEQLLWQLAQRSDHLLRIMGSIYPAALLLLWGLILFEAAGSRMHLAAPARPRLMGRTEAHAAPD